METEGDGGDEEGEEEVLVLVEDLIVLIVLCQGMRGEEERVRMCAVFGGIGRE